jgi:hypothetical protein
VGCHTPLRNNDYVFTVPLRDRAVLSGNLPFHPLDWKVITSSIDKQGATMSTLYGNDVAVRYARSGSGKDYPAGAVVSLVTWTEREDDHWFGALIPGEVKSVEFVSVREKGDKTSYAYERYAGSPLKRTQALAGQSEEDRAAYLLSQRAAVMP